VATSAATRWIASTKAPESFELQLLNVQRWMCEADCRDLNPDLFSPISENSDALVGPAKQVCTGCPVRRDCLEYALTESLPVDTDPQCTPQIYRKGAWMTGIWGGTTTSERVAIRRTWTSR
jgi:WhiB family redox-sensing transcriptional regulator